MWWDRKKKSSRHSRAVVAEAERMLAGRSLEGFTRAGRRVPAWSLVAILAHSTRADLMRMAAPSAGPDPVGWSGTVACLARELLIMTVDDADLLGLQRQTLIPLELNLLGGYVRPPATSSDLAVLVIGALDRRYLPES